MSERTSNFTIRLPLEELTADFCPISSVSIEEFGDISSVSPAEMSILSVSSMSSVVGMVSVGIELELLFSPNSDP